MIGERYGAWRVADIFQGSRDPWPWAWVVSVLEPNIQGRVAIKHLPELRPTQED